MRATQYPSQAVPPDKPWETSAFSIEQSKSDLLTIGSLRPDQTSKDLKSEVFPGQTSSLIAEGAAALPP
jgi:hypothetical protein